MIWAAYLDCYKCLISTVVNNFVQQVEKTTYFIFPVMQWDAMFKTGNFELSRSTEILEGWYCELSVARFAINPYIVWSLSFSLSLSSFLTTFMMVISRSITYNWKKVTLGLSNWSYNNCALTPYFVIPCYPWITWDNMG